MYYFKSNNEEIEKYEIAFNREEIIKLRAIISKECSIWLPKEAIDTSFPYPNKVCRNIKEEKIGQRSSFDDERTVYRYTYEEFVEPKLVSLIDRLLNNDMDAVLEILAYKPFVPESPQEKLARKKEELIALKPEGFTKVYSKIDEIIGIINTKEVEEEPSKEVLYLEQLKGLIRVIQIDTYPISTLRNVEKFLNVRFSTEEGSTSIEGGARVIKLNKN